LFSRGWALVAGGLLSVLLASCIGGGVVQIPRVDLNWRAQYVQGTTWLGAVTYGDGLFVAVGGNGAIFTSPDGLAWTKRSFPGSSSPDFNGVAYGADRYVAVGYGGLIATSPDGVNWTTQTSPTNRELNAVAYGRGLFVAVGAGGTILTSEDGESWTSQNSGTAASLTGVTYGNDRFVAVGYDLQASRGVALVSQDGVNWTVQTLEAWPRNVAYGNGVFLTVSGHKVLTSQDGVRWSLREFLDIYVHRVGFGNGVWVALGNPGVLYASRDAVNWTRQRNGVVDEGFNGVGYGAGRFVVVGGFGLILTSDVVP